jgi:hypothetical protein
LIWSYPERTGAPNARVPAVSRSGKSTEVLVRRSRFHPGPGKKLESADEKLDYVPTSDDFKLPFLISSALQARVRSP